MCNLALAVSQGHPVLLQGVTGAGKTALINHLAQLTGNTGNVIRCIVITHMCRYDEGASGRPS